MKTPHFAVVQVTSSGVIIEIKLTFAVHLILEGEFLRWVDGFHRFPSKDRKLYTLSPQFFPQQCSFYEFCTTENPLRLNVEPPFSRMKSFQKMLST